VAQLIGLGMLPPDQPAAVAQFLIANDGKLDPSLVGDFLGGDGALPSATAGLVMDSLSFRGMPLDSALRKMISVIKLPGESQRIDRLVECFAKRWHSANPSDVDHEDTAYMIAFSLTMLNSDLHSSRNKRKMTRDQYLNQLRGTCKDGSSPNPAMLHDFYTRVARLEWAVEERIHMRVVREGWVHKKSSRKVNAQDKRLYALLSSRALYFFAEASDTEPAAYIRLEGMTVVPLPKGRFGFEMRPLSHIKDGKDTEVRMVKLLDKGNGVLVSEQSRHSTFAFTVETEREAAGWLCAIRDYTLDPPSHVSSAAKRVDSINHTDGSSSTTRRRRRTGSLDPEAAAASITPDESGKIMKRVNSFGRRRGAADEASRAAQSSISTAPSPTSKGGNDASGSTNSNGAGLTLRERRARSASNVGAAVSGISSRHSLSLRASREPHSALAMLERKYEGVEMRTGAAGGQGGSEGNLQVQELDEGATDAMVALAEAWLEERSLSLADDAARAALRAHCSFFSSETEIHDLLGEAYMMQVDRLERLGAEEGEAAASAAMSTLIAADLPLPPPIHALSATWEITSESPQTTNTMTKIPSLDVAAASAAEDSPDFHPADTNRDGRVDKDEFKSWILAQERDRLEAEAAEAAAEAAAKPVAKGEADEEDSVEKARVDASPSTTPSGDNGSIDEESFWTPRVKLVNLSEKPVRAVVVAMDSFLEPANQGALPHEDHLVPLPSPTSPDSGSEAPAPTALSAPKPAFAAPAATATPDCCTGQDDESSTATMTDADKGQDEGTTLPPLLVRIPSDTHVGQAPLPLASSKQPMPAPMLPPPMTAEELDAYRSIFKSVAGPLGTVSRHASQAVFDKASASTSDVEVIWGLLVRARRRRRRRRRAALASGQAMLGQPDGMPVEHPSPADMHGEVSSIAELSETEFAVALHLAAAKYRGLLPSGFPAELPDTLLLPDGTNVSSPRAAPGTHDMPWGLSTHASSFSAPASVHPSKPASPRSQARDAPGVATSLARPTDAAPFLASTRANSRRVVPIGNDPAAIRYGGGAAARAAAADKLAATLDAVGMAELVRAHAAPHATGGGPAAEPSNASRQLSDVLKAMRDRKAGRAAATSADRVSPPPNISPQGSNGRPPRFAETFSVPPPPVATVSAPVSKLPSPSSTSGFDSSVTKRSHTAALLDAANRAASAYNTLAAQRGRVRDDRAAVMALFQRTRSNPSIVEKAPSLAGGYGMFHSWAPSGRPSPSSSPREPVGASLATSASCGTNAAISALNLRLINDYAAASSPPTAGLNLYPSASPVSSVHGSMAASPEGGPPFPSPHSPRRIAVFKAAQQMASRTGPASVSSFHLPPNYPSESADALHSALPVLLTGGVLIKWQPGGLPPAPFFFWVEPTPLPAGSRRAMSAPMGLGTSAVALVSGLPPMPPYASHASAPPTPVLAWRDPAAARGGAPLATLATQRVPLCAIARVATPSGALLERLRLWSSEGKLGPDVADGALTDCTIALSWEKGPGSVDTVMGEGPQAGEVQPSSPNDDADMLLFAPDIATRDEWLQSLLQAVHASRTLAATASERATEKVGERLARARQAGRANRRQKAQASQPQQQHVNVAQVA